MALYEFPSLTLASQNMLVFYYLRVVSAAGGILQLGHHVRFSIF